MLGLFRRKKAPDYGGCAKQIAFIVGTGRCGTTILAQVLNAHSKICVPHELQFFVSIGNGERLYEKYADKRMSRFAAKHFIRLIENRCTYHFDRFFDFRKHFKSLSYPQTDYRQVLIDLFDHICYTHKKEVFVEQTPWYGQRLDTLKEFFPEMKVIHVVRDGRDVALSFARTPWWSNDIGHNLLQWEREINVIRAFGKKHCEGFCEVRYEDLVSSPEKELKTILELFGLGFEPAMLDPSRLINYYAMLKFAPSPYQSKAFMKWSQKSERVFFPENLYAWKRDPQEAFTKLPKEVQATMQEYGYELT